MMIIFSHRRFVIIILRTDSADISELTTGAFFPCFINSPATAGKADAMLDPATLAPGKCIVFVDDSIAELIDSRLTSKYKKAEQLHRVLFSRAKL
jgi:hypothetical protein